ncbi:hypothetical protein D0Z07_5234 [Hyphodiscus hymeniophilus]|uniref:Uncharacterized protein n=1 Tax=Hyphodiscus hymeniophilus TaxID=353542 RepID=A0A9P7AWH5_9HELO|nr:hypothetical protein D0Z07_5234 [Hyphodiscus hymeniophilus]
MLFKSLAVVATAGLAVAQRPTNTSICDYYTTALLKNNTAANQLALLTLVVNTAVIGNYTPVTVGTGVPGILAKGTVNGTEVNLLPYFSGGLASSNRGGAMGVSVNFLDDGGAAPLMKNMPSNGNSSAQYLLLTHLYEYFGVLLGCSMQGGADYPGYLGHASMYEVHKFMDLSYAEVTYFISQVAASAASFGVATDDLTIVGTALNSAFNVRCAPPTTIIMSQGAQLNSICIDDTCPTAPNATCASYNATMEPAVSNSTSSATATSSGSGSGTSPSSTATGSSPATVTTGAAATVGMSFAAVAAGLFAAFL